MGQVMLSIFYFLVTILVIQGMPSNLEEGFKTMNPEQTVAVQALALKSAIDNGDSDKIESIIKKINLMRDDAIDYLAYGGIDSDYAALAYDAFLPALETAGVDEDTTYIALQTIANLVCRDTYEGVCDVAEALSHVTKTPHYGCNDSCFCLNQKDIFLWTRFVSKSKQATEEMKSKFFCSGLNGKTLEECTCNGVEELDVKDNKDPVTRQSSDAIMQMMLQQMAASGADPATLSIMANMGSGASSEEAIKQMMMAQMGLDSSMTHLMLNGGQFHEDEDKNKELMLKFMAKKSGIPAEMIPLLTGDPDAQDFYIYNMILTGDIDAMTGFTLLARGDTVDQDALNDLLTNGLMEGKDMNAILANAVKPYMPQLPAGIYPGSALSFAHFEALEVSTCALHDLRNRFDCGYIGISAYDCEIAPYCCYAPVFMTDEQVVSSTDGAITAASSIPWCYYNVFFTFPTEFSLAVQTIGGFPAPHQCLSYFKFGLDLGDTFSALAGENTQITNPRDDCGFPGITEFHCVAIRGCCFDANAPVLTPQCHKPTEGAPSILNAPIPEMFIGVEGQCDANVFKIPFLYYHRVPCHYTLNQYSVGFDILQVPTKEDCLTRLHCCYEPDDAVIAAYPGTPRCYHKLAGGNVNPMPIDAALLTQRIGSA